MEQISSGAEAIIFKIENQILKKRITKNYRISELDDKLRKSRTKKEAKIIQKLYSAGLNVPKIITVDKFDIVMEYVEGEKVRDCLNKNILFISEEIGKFLAKIHNLDIVHGDLTTSNIIYDSKANKIYFIDFGLSQVSLRIEDKAVDLHLLKQALESYHYDCWDESFEIILNEYSNNCVNSKEILKRFSLVEKRGRNKH